MYTSSRYKYDAALRQRQMQYENCLLDQHLALFRNSIDTYISKSIPDNQNDLLLLL